MISLYVSSFKGKKEFEIDELDISFCRFVVSSLLPDALKKAADSEETLQECNRLIELCTNHLQSDPNNIKSIEYRSAAYFRTNKYDDAMSDFNKIADLIPTKPYLYLERAKYFQRKKKFSEAISDYSRVIEIEPKCADVYLERARCYHQKIMYSEAISDYSKAIELNPDCSEIYFIERADCCAQHDKVNEALSDYNRSEERKKIIADLSHSIKNLISTVIDPLENLRQEPSIKPQVIENALKGANLIREIVNAMNLSFKGSIDDFRYDAKHNTDTESQDLKSILIEALKHSVGNMFDGKYFGTFMREYFPEKSLYLNAKEEWSTLSQSNDLNEFPAIPGRADDS